MSTLIASDDSLATNKFPHILELDGLRAIAIGSVFVGHIGILAKFPGGFGVTIFFFLSGFLITSLLRVEKHTTAKINLKNFYVRRFLRINPPLWATMAFVLAAGYMGAFALEVDLFQLTGQAFFFTNYIMADGRDGRLPIPLWSLAVEEHFYLAFPALYILASRTFKDIKIASLCAFACFVILVIRSYSATILGEYFFVYYWTHTRIDSILFGCILALWQNPVLDRNPWRPSILHFGAAIVIVLVTFAVRSPDFREGLRYTLQGGALFVIFSFILSEKGLISALLKSQPLQIVGKYSYTLYLIHFPAIVSAHYLFPDWPNILTALFAGVVSFAFAALMYRLVEQPLARARHRLNHKKDSTA